MAASDMQADDALQLVSPVPPDVPPPSRGPSGAIAAARYTYRNQAGAVLSHILRFEEADATGDTRKRFLPFTYWQDAAGRGQWRPKALPAPRPLYGLDLLAQRPAAPVLVCEGEKAAEAARRLFPELVAVTSPNGARNAGKADWTPLAGRDVTIWPDHDAEGETYAAEVAALALKAGAQRVAISAVPADFPPKWDLADTPPEGHGPDSLRALLRAAAPPPPPASPAATTAASTSDDLPPQFRRGRDGIWYDQPGEDAPLHVCGPLECVAEAREAGGTGWCKLFRITDGDGLAREVMVPLAMLAGEGRELRALFLDRGFSLPQHRGARDRFMALVSGMRAANRLRLVSAGGWHGDAFLLGERVIGETPGEELRRRSAAPDHPFCAAGTLEDWQAGVAAPAAGNSRLVFSICAALAAPLAPLLGGEAGGFHIYGPSSTGKTTALRLAASVFGGGERPPYVKSWRATANGLEGTAQLFNHLLLCLDEVGQVEAAELDATAYMLANGQGKARANRDGTGRPAASWFVSILSSGEVPIPDKIAEDPRRQAKAGQRVRFADVPADAGRGLGIFETLPEGTTPAAFAQELRAASAQSHGTAGPVFIAELAAHRAAILPAARDWIGRWIAAHVPPGAASQVQRVAERFAAAAVAGELAIRRHILPWQPGEAERAAVACFMAWLRQRGGIGQAEVQDAADRIARFIAEHGATRFGVARRGGVEEPRQGPRAGYRRVGEDGEVEAYLVLPPAWQQLRGGAAPEALADAMMARGWLLPDSKGRPCASVHVPGLGRTLRCYRLAPGILNGGGTDG
jgi:uncharacterized protein (DUF927 family)